MLQFYWGSGSPFAWRVMLALELKSVPYESKLLQFSKQEHKSPEVMALNPRGKVPVLKDGDFAIYESLAILTYLERRFPEPPIFGRTPEEAGGIMVRISEFISYLENPLRQLSRAVFGSAPGLQEAALATAKAETFPILHEEFQHLETLLTGKSWLVGEAISAADLFLLPGVQSLIRALTRPVSQDLKAEFLPLAERYPALEAWKARMEALPFYEKTVPPHWRENP